MDRQDKELGTARASPLNDAQAHRPKPVTSGQGLPCQVRARLKTRVPKRKLRFATWNIGSLTGRCRELADVLVRRRVQCAFLQETRWKGNKSRNIGQGYRLIYTGSPSGKAGVAVVLSEELQNGLLEVDRRCDRLMRVRVLIEGVITNLISAYTPQAGCSGSEKESFWEQFEEVLRAIPAAEVIIVGGDLNGHVGRAADTYERVHGGFGYGRRNAEGETILRTCIASDLAVVNTFFQKTSQHLITYKSGSHSTQLDYLLTRRCHIGKVTNCKVIPGESLTAQHRLLVMDFVVTPKKKVAEKREPRIRWWLLNGTMQTNFRAAVESQNLLTHTESAQEAWDRVQSAIITAGKRVLGLSRGGRVIDRETWWWNDEVQEVIRKKKAAFKEWQQSHSPEDRLEYIAAKRASKRAVARARSDRLSPLYDTLETAEGQKLIYKLARARDKATQDIAKCLCVKDSQGTLLCNHASVKERWRCYFKELLNTQHPCSLPTEPPPNLGLIAPITPDETRNCLRRMKNRKAVGPDDIPIEAWKSLGSLGVLILTDLFNRILNTGTMPHQWRYSFITPIYKGRGSVQDCGSYRGVKIMSHTMKLFERMIDLRLRRECTVSECQYGFQPGSGTLDAIFAIRTLMEAYREKRRALHVAFLDLQKAFDCVPRQCIWWALRTKGIPEAYIDIIRDMYRDSVSMVRTAVGDTKPFPISVGVHQGSALSPFLFNVVLDTVSANIQDQPPWLMMYADDIALIDEDRLTLERRVNLWKGALENGGLKLNVSKTEYMACGSPDSCTIHIGPEPAVKSEKFRYLGSILHESGGIDHDVQARISAAWAKWREVTGVVCDRRIPPKLKGLIYKSIIRPVLLYGSECWPVLSRHTQELHVTEMKMLRWMCGVTRADRIRNTFIRGSLGVRDVADKLEESRLRWYGHVARRPENYVGRICLDMCVPGARPPGRPKKRWLDTVKQDMRANGLTTEDAKDRAKWRRLCGKADPS
ncbi:unnamed protein product [Danaus chrysippus]|uniref:(African queen) hypothetical protein n=1 Tax=Danaus chrysippus TaxID=151541 RepID=A0A8J2VVW5_9NEOP|nr:unnamed protein product [Danaus chrysippus]